MALHPADFKTFHSEIDHLNTAIRKNSFLRILLIYVLRDFLRTCLHLNLLFRTYLKGICSVKLPFLESTSFEIRKKFQKLFTNKLTSCNLKIVFTSYIWVKSFFRFKHKLPKMLLSGLVYKYGGCNAIYHGRTKCHF